MSSAIDNPTASVLANPTSSAPAHTLANPTPNLLPYQRYANHPNATPRAID